MQHFRTDAADSQPVIGLAYALLAEDRPQEALKLCDYILSVEGAQSPAHYCAARALARLGRVAEAHLELRKARENLGDSVESLETSKAVLLAALQHFNDRVSRQEAAEAFEIIEAMFKIAPGSLDIASTALKLALAIGDEAKIVFYGLSIVEIQRDDWQANFALANIYEANGDYRRQKLRLVIGADPQQFPLGRLNEMLETVSAVVCGGPIENDIKDMIDTVRDLANEVIVTGEDPEQMHLLEMHYKVLLESCDLQTPYLEFCPPSPPLDFVVRASDKLKLDVCDFATLPDVAEAEVVFYVSADMDYIEDYARPYLLSVLRSADVPFVVVVNVIGGRELLDSVAEKIGVRDHRIFFAGDSFDDSKVNTLCYAEYPIGLIKKPVAHLQSARFQRLEKLLDTVDHPVLVSDIDCILERGVKDLLYTHRLDDVVLNENMYSKLFPARITANLLMFRPTPGGKLFSKHLCRYLDFHLNKQRVSRWIDQIALMLTRCYVVENAPECKLGYFDTASDINNLIYKTYRPHPFRFLSLYRGFDMTTLNSELR